MSCGPVAAALALKLPSIPRQFPQDANHSPPFTSGVKSTTGAFAHRVEGAVKSLLALEVTVNDPVEAEGQMPSME